MLSKQARVWCCVGCGVRCKVRVQRIRWLGLVLCKGVKLGMKFNKQGLGLVLY